MATEKHPLKPLQWFFTKHFGNFNTARTGISIAILAFLGIILLQAFAISSITLTLGFAIISGTSAFIGLVSLIKSLWDHITENEDEVFNSTAESLFFEFSEWAKKHQVALFIGTGLFIGILTLALFIIFSPLPLLSIPVIGSTVAFVATGFVGVSGALASALAFGLIGITLIVIWDIACRIMDAIFFPNENEISLKTYRLRAKTGDPEAQFQLGLCYEKGLKGADEDYNETANWYKFVMDREQYIKNNEEKQGEANRYYSLAMEQGHLRAALRLGNYYFNQITSNSSSLEEFYEQVKKAENQHIVASAIHCHEIATSQGDLNAEYTLGLLHYGQSNFKTAFQHFSHAAESGHAHATFQLANCYAEGKGTEKDLKKATWHYQQLAGQGNADACYHLAMLHYDENQKEEAKKWLKQCIAQNNKYLNAKIKAFLNQDSELKASVLTDTQKQEPFWSQIDYKTQNTFGLQTDHESDQSEQNYEDSSTQGEQEISEEDDEDSYSNNLEAGS